MKILLTSAAALATLAGCSTGPSFACNAPAAQVAVGRMATMALMEDARREANARMVRTVRPGEVTTQEFNAERLTLDVGADDVVQRARCG